MIKLSKNFLTDYSIIVTRQLRGEGCLIVLRWENKIGLVSEFFFKNTGSHCYTVGDEEIHEFVKEFEDILGGKASDEGFETTLFLATKAEASRYITAFKMGG